MRYIKVVIAIPPPRLHGIKTTAVEPPKADMRRGITKAKSIIATRLKADTFFM